MKKLKLYRELALRHRIAKADESRPRPSYTPQQLADFQELAVTTRDLSYALHVAALSGHSGVDFGFPGEMPSVLRCLLLARALRLLEVAGLKAPAAVRPVNVRTLK